MSERSYDLVRLSGAANFRDCGGYVTADGRRVRRGRLFRSSDLSQLTAEDCEILDRLGLKTIVDLRTVGERMGRASRWNPKDVTILASTKANADAMLSWAFELSELNTEEQWREAFAASYATFPELYAEELTVLFRSLVEGLVPLLVNCSTGKDRTGVAVAIVLRMLRVPIEAVVENYLQTAIRLPSDFGFVQMISGSVQTRPLLLPRHALKVLLGVDRALLLSALEAINRKYGTLSAYLTDRLGISVMEQTALIQSFTE